MKNTRRQFKPQEKVRILRLHLLEQKPISDICDEYGLNPTVFYRWQKQFFEHGAAAFERNKNGSADRKLEKQNAWLKAKLAYKDQVIAEIVADHVRLKKELGLG
ncbi:MAG: transposase [Candidatus Binatia bacterium]